MHMLVYPLLVPFSTLTLSVVLLSVQGISRSPPQQWSCDGEDGLAMAHRRTQLTAEVDVDDDIIADGFFGNNCQEPDERARVCTVSTPIIGSRSIATNTTGLSILLSSSPSSPSSDTSDATSDPSLPPIKPYDALFRDPPKPLGVGPNPKVVSTPKGGVYGAVLGILGYYSKESELIRGANALYRAVTRQADDETFLRGGLWLCHPVILILQIKARHLNLDRLLLNSSTQLPFPLPDDPSPPLPPPNPPAALGLPSQFRTHHALLVLHTWLALLRLRKEGAQGAAVGQTFYHTFNHDVERRVVAAGVKMLVSKWMRELERSFYGAAAAYDAAVAPGASADALPKALWR
ncbi:unnamed protein product [Closterium sp. NIES-53]